MSILISEVLGKGRENATDYTILMMRTGIGTRRQLYRQVERERCELGIPILTNRDGGYYLADTETDSGRRDLYENIRHLEKMGKSNYAAAAALRKSYSDERESPEGRQGGKEEKQ